MANSDNAAFHSPDALLVNFSRSRIGMCVVAAILAHVVLIGATSSGYIRDKWLDPEGAKLRAEQEQLKAAAAKPAPPAQAAAATPAAATTAAAAAPAAAAGDEVDISSLPDSELSQAQLLERYKHTRVVQEATAVAKPEEIPAYPGDDLGISIKDTNF